MDDHLVYSYQGILIWCKDSIRVKTQAFKDSGSAFSTLGTSAHLLIPPSPPISGTSLSALTVEPSSLTPAWRYGNVNDKMNKRRNIYYLRFQLIFLKKIPMYSALIPC